MITIIMLNVRYTFDIMMPCVHTHGWFSYKRRNINYKLQDINAAHKETSVLLRSTQNIVRRKHHVPVHGVPSTAISVPNYVRYDAKTSLDY